MTAATVLPVEYIGIDAGEAPPTWGQSAIWRAIQWYGEHASYFNVVKSTPVPDGCTLADLCATLRELFERHPGLRNHFRLRDGRLVQDVQGRGTIDLELLPCRPDDVAEASDALIERFGAHLFVVGAAQVRLCAVTVDDRPVTLVMGASHLALDGWAMGLLVERVATALRGDTVADDAEPWDTFRQAAYEATPQAQRGGQAVVEAWRRQLEHAPLRAFRTPHAAPEPCRWHRLDLDSAAIAAAAELLADRLAVSTSAVLLTATAAAVATLTGAETWVLQLIAGNRHIPRRRAVADAAAQNALLVLQPTAELFDDLLRQVYRAASLSYSRAHYDPAAMWAMLDELSAARGEAAQLTSYFNDARGGQDRWDGLDVTGLTPDTLRGLTGATEVRWSGSWQLQDCHFFMHVHRLPGRCRLRLLADTAFVPRPQMVAVLRGIERLVVEAAARPVRVDEIPALLDVSTGARPARRGKES